MKKQGTYSEACAEVWNTLSSINCNEHVEKKNGLTFLSWSWAYQTIMKHYPDFVYEMLPVVLFKNETTEVHCKVKVGCNGYVIEKEMWLPVMDHRNRSIPNADSVAINKSKMRCLTKAISMLGLGAYIYAGEDLPQEGDDDNKMMNLPPTHVVPVVKQDGVTKVQDVPPEALSVVETPVLSEVPAEVPAADKLKTEEDAHHLTGALIEIARGMHSGSLKELTEFWVINKGVIDQLDQHWPKQYAQLKAAFTQIKSQLVPPQEATQ